MRRTIARIAVLRPTYLLTLPTDDWLRLVDRVQKAGLKAKPEVGIQFGAGGASAAEALEAEGLRRPAPALRPRALARGRVGCVRAQYGTSTASPTNRRRVRRRSCTWSSWCCRTQPACAGSTPPVSGCSGAFGRGGQQEAAGIGSPTRSTPMTMWPPAPPVP